MLESTRGGRGKKDLDTTASKERREGGRKKR